MSNLPATPPKTTPSVALVICAEPGFLEPQTHLLVRSVRAWGGALAQMPVHIYKPREGGAFSAESLALYDSFGVHFHEKPLNRQHRDYPMANPIYVGVEAERNLSEDVIVLCDCDTVFLNEPTEFLLEPDVNIGVQPVRRRNRGSVGPGDPYDEFWQAMYQACGLQPRRYVTTMTDRIRIRGYWNAGLVVTRRSTGLMARWLAHFASLHDAALSKGGSLAALDQLALAPTVDLCDDHEVHELSFAYNYVLPQRALMVDQGMRHATIDELVHVHYHRWFNRNGFLRAVHPEFDATSPRVAWLEQYLPLQPAHDEPLHGLESGATSAEERRKLHASYARAFKQARRDFFSAAHEH